MGNSPKLPENSPNFGDRGKGTPVAKFGDISGRGTT